MGAAQAVMRYFDLAAPDHHADEEEDLFPALLEAVAGSDAVCLRNLIAGLEQEHHALGSLWQELHARLAQLAAGVLVPLAVDDVLAFEAAYARHIGVEEGEVLPMAERLLDATTLDGIADAMRRRRGISASAPGGRTSGRRAPPG
jgi:hemerythrin-like domain-containing protein